MTVDWAEDARVDLREIHFFTLHRTSQHADEVQERLISIGEGLEHWPHIGHAGALPGTLELLVWPGPYRLVYKVQPPQITILRVVHGKRPWPA